MSLQLAPIWLLIQWGGIHGRHAQVIFIYTQRVLYNANCFIIFTNFTLLWIYKNSGSCIIYSYISQVIISKFLEKSACLMEKRIGHTKMRPNNNASWVPNAECFSKGAMTNFIIVELRQILYLHTLMCGFIVALSIS